MQDTIYLTQYLGKVILYYNYMLSNYQYSLLYKQFLQLRYLNYKSLLYNLYKVKILLIREDRILEDRVVRSLILKQNRVLKKHYIKIIKQLKESLTSKIILITLIPTIKLPILLYIILILLELRDLFINLRLDLLYKSFRRLDLYLQDKVITLPTRQEASSYLYKLLGDMYKIYT